MNYHEKKALFYKVFVCTPEGRAVLEAINKECHVGDDLFRDDPRRQDYTIGRHSIAVWINKLTEEYSSDMNKKGN